MITIHKLGVQGSCSDQELSALREQFLKTNFIRFQNLIDSTLLEEIYSQIEAAEWENRTHDGIGEELCVSDAGLVSLINFVLNDPHLFRIIQEITGCENIGCFQGRVYRMMPSSGHYDSWHSDVGEDRLLALSLNLGKQAYEGGTLELRQGNSSHSIVEAPNLQFGQAILFRLSPELRHRVTNVQGSISKTAFAGWFKSSPDLWATLTEFSQPNQKEPS